MFEYNYYACNYYKRTKHGILIKKIIAKIKEQIIVNTEFIKTPD